MIECHRFLNLTSCVLQNPYRPTPPGLGLGKKADYPAELRKEFEEGPRGGGAWVAPHNPALLDYLDAEFLLIGHSHDLGRTSNTSLQGQPLKGKPPPQPVRYSCGIHAGPSFSSKA